MVFHKNQGRSHEFVNERRAAAARRQEQPRSQQRSQQGPAPASLPVRAPHWGPIPSRSRTQTRSALPIEVHQASYPNARESLLEHVSQQATRQWAPPEAYRAPTASPNDHYYCSGQTGSSSSQESPPAYSPPLEAHHATPNEAQESLVETPSVGHWMRETPPDSADGSETPPPPLSVAQGILFDQLGRPLGWQDQVA
ncbi:hypothetical protein K491DRAFT_781719, partial [Lophiostoma macrostomum CBS 122681]